MKNTRAPLLLALFLTALSVFYACEKAQEQILVESISVNKTSAELVEGESITLTAKIAPSNATNKNFSWKSDNAGVATIDQNGKVTAIKAGKAMISVISEDGGKSATCAVTVKAKVINISSVTLNKTSASLKAGETVTLTATVNPSDATDKTVTWTTSDATVATVSNGVVTAKKVGTATITAKAGEKTASCAILVEATSVTSISIDKTSASLKVGETVTLTATVNPDDATDKTVSWTSSDETVAAVSNGVVTAKKVGTATITAKAGDKTATCAITVEPFYVTGISLDQTNITLNIGESQTLKATITPENATDKMVIWTSSNSSVATVDNNGKVSAVKAGNTTITATTRDGGKTATCAVTVKAKVINVSSVTLNKTSASLKADETVTLTATVNPSDATDKTVTWTTSDATVATVSNGVVTAKKVGTATITAKAGDKTATCAITVEPFYVTGISLDQTNITLNIGESQTLKATITPENATDKMVIWTSSNSSVATVDNNGKVSAVKAGNTTITATTRDGRKTATCSVKVNSDGINVGIDDWGNGGNIGGEVG